MIDPYWDTIVKSRIDLYSKEDVNYGIPTHVGASVAFYNTEILEEAGVNYEDIVTWEDFKQAGIQVYENRQVHGNSRYKRTWQASMLLAQQGADLTDDSGNPIVNSEAMVKAMTRQGLAG